ncbi:MAG: hypothetical protein OXC44_07245 [Proteobacteria bacterium]|nr:hypothetical protein [Pseudomonadota bacterium]
MDIAEKVSRINKDPSIYGTFAEIGAGQEVAHAFFKGGKASSTIAKTMSAYDMKFSDAIYGEDEYYVSRKRLIRMLNKEIDLLQNRLQDRRVTSKFFVFANTVATGSQRRQVGGHGWLGVAFQHHPMAEISQAVVHIRFLPRLFLQQHRAVGLIGVNLLYACYFHLSHQGEFISSLKDELDLDVLEVDGVDFSGVAFKHVDNRSVVLDLVKRGLSGAVLFDQQGQPKPPSVHLHKKHLVATRGSFRPLTLGKWAIMRAGWHKHISMHGLNEDEILHVAGISLADVHLSGALDVDDFLARVDLLASMGICVLISEYLTDFSFVECLNKYTSLSKALVVGTHSLTKVLDETRYLHLKGGLLEALGIMVSHNATLYLYPIKLPRREVLASDCVFLSQNKRLLLNYMQSTGLCTELTPLETSKESSDDDKRDENIEEKDTTEYISAENVRILIENNEPWECYVPTKVVDFIKKHRLYGYKKDV